jgi:hypothetical protein
MQPHDIVALIRDVEDRGLVRGQVGTVVEMWRPGVFEVEFADVDGRAYAFAALPEETLMPLHFQPVQQAA